MLWCKGLIHVLQVQAFYDAFVMHTLPHFCTQMKLTHTYWELIKFSFLMVIFIEA